MRSSNSTPAPHVKQRYLPMGLRIRMENYYREYGNAQRRTEEKIKKYIEKHRHQPDYLNALQSSVYKRGSIFSWAIQNHCIDIARRMLDCDGVDVNQVDLFGGVPLVRCLKGLIDNPYNNLAEKLLSYPGVNVMQRGESDSFPLVLALKKKKPQLAVMILQKGKCSAPVLAQALTIAIKEGYTEVVNMILTANSVAVDLDDLTSAISGDYVDIVTAILNLPNLSVNPFDLRLVAALQRAANENRYQMIKCFVDRKLDIGVHLFVWAAQHDYRDIIEVLLARADFDGKAKFEDQHNILTKVIEVDQHWAAERLLACRKEVDINFHAKNGDTALMIAAARSSQSIVTILLDRPEVEVDAKNNFGQTALHFAAESDFAAGVELLCKHEADVNDKNGSGESPLIVAVRHNAMSTVSALLQDNRIDLTIADNTGKTALMIAAEKGMTKVVAMLLKHDAGNVNVQDANGDTALILAARAHDDAIIIKALLSHGADPQIENQSSYTALMVAKKAGHKGLCPLLKGFVPVVREYFASPVDPLNIASAPPLDQNDAAGLMSAASVPPLSLQKNGLFGGCAEAESAPAVSEAASPEYGSTPRT